MDPARLKKISVFRDLATRTSSTSRTWRPSLRAGPARTRPRGRLSYDLLAIEEARRR